MKDSTLKQIEQNINNGNSVTVSYSELRHWYEIENAEMDEIFDVNVTLEGGEYWLSINNDEIADEIITSEDTGNMADWLFCRN